MSKLFRRLGQFMCGKTIETVAKDIRTSSKNAKETANSGSGGSKPNPDLKTDIVSEGVKITVTQRKRNS